MKRFNGERRRDVRGLGKVLGGHQRHYAHGAHRGRAVVQGESLLRPELHRLEPRRLERFGSEHDAPLITHFSEPQQREREVRERAEIAAGAHRPLRRDNRGNSQVQKCDELMQRREADTRKPPDETVDPQQHHGPRDLLGERLADAAGMALQEILLQQATILAGDVHRGEVAEARGDAVDNVVGVLPGFNGGGRLLHLPGGLFVQFDSPPVARDAEHILEGKRHPVETYSVLPLTDHHATRSPFLKTDFTGETPAW